MSEKDRYNRENYGSSAKKKKDIEMQQQFNEQRMNADEWERLSREQRSQKLPRIGEIDQSPRVDLSFDTDQNSYESKAAKRSERIKDYASKKTPKKLKNPTDLQVRFRTGFVYVALSIVAILAGDIPTVILLVLMSGITAKEFFFMLRSDAKMPNEVIGIVGSILYVLAMYTFGLQGVTVVTACILFALVVWYVYFMRARITDLSVSFFGAVYTGLFLSFFVPIRRALPAPWGGILLLTIFLSVWGNDAFAYLVGSKFGKHKLAPRTSPSKSWEGFIVGVLFSVVMWVAMIFIPGVNMAWWQAILFGAIAGAVGVLGDLAESRIKRNSGCKDSGTLMPGHGGFFDRCDSMFIVAAVSAALLIGFKCIPSVL